MVVNEPTAIARLSIDVIKLAILRWVVWRVRALRCFESPRTAFGSPSRRSMLALLAFVSFSPTPAVKANHQADGANV